MTFNNFKVQGTGKTSIHFHFGAKRNFTGSRGQCQGLIKKKLKVFCNGGLQRGVYGDDPALQRSERSRNRSAPVIRNVNNKIKQYNGFRKVRQCRITAACYKRKWWALVPGRMREIFEILDDKL